MKPCAGAWCVVGVSIGIALAGERAASAQIGEGQTLRLGANINPNELYPDRDLVLLKSTLEAFGGGSFTLSEGLVFRPVLTPFGVGYGLLPSLEIGASSAVELARPDPLSVFAVDMPRVYVRYAVVEDLLALEGSVFIPLGKLGDRFAYRLEAPLRFRATHDLTLIGAATYTGILGNDLGAYEHIAQLGGAAMYRFAERFWAAFEVGLTARNFDFSRAFVPMGISAGFEIFPRLSILPGFRFPDIGTGSMRVLQILAVYAFDIGIGHTGGESTPDIPYQPQAPDPERQSSS